MFTFLVVFFANYHFFEKKLFACIIITMWWLHWLWSLCFAKNNLWLLNSKLYGWKQKIMSTLCTFFFLISYFYMVHNINEDDDDVLIISLMTGQSLIKIFFSMLHNRLCVLQRFMLLLFFFTLFSSIKCFQNFNWNLKFYHFQLKNMFHYE